MEEVDIGLKGPSIFSLPIRDKLTMVMGEVDIVPRPTTLPPITKATMVDCCVYMFILAIYMIVLMKIK